ncbi:probable serine hydrolase [Episyrphus balteatus]|uniref:probable serine hydrolase n=1 Tax=Episyrphus balteatus TaxID=286459 RepID=UPI002486B83C|nr:probable serine hydrolase [Episyrphus balteatus]
MRTASGVSISKLFLKRSLQIQDLFVKDIKKYSTSLATREFEDIQISVPWGHIAGKWYGPKNTRPIVGLHGWQDNAGTYDTLAPLLPTHLGFLSIDLPGHGLSSQLPEGCTYHSIDYVNTLFTIMREFKWNKISMICHSMSAINGFIFTSLFPDKCDMYVALDNLKPVLRTKPEHTIKTITERFAGHTKQIEFALKDTKPPCYEYEEIVERLYKGTSKSISKECCKFILQRNMKPSEEEPNKYYFSRDGRLKSMMFFLFPHEVVVEMAQRIKCPHLFIKALNAPKYDMKADYEEVLNTLKQNPLFEHHIVSGTHHVHLNEPQKIADIVNPFINKYRPV